MKISKIFLVSMVLFSAVDVSGMELNRKTLSVGVVLSIIALGLFKKRAGKPKEGPGRFSFDDWYTACKLLPKWRDLQGMDEFVQCQTPLSWEVVQEQLQDYFKVMKTGTLGDPACWLEDAPSLDSPFFDTTVSVGFKPFVQKIVVKPGAKIARHGDLHGDVHSLLECIKYYQAKGFMRGFKIIDPEFYMLFLGDYVDRGNNGIEVISTLMRLKIENPNQVFMTRGNHEDIGISGRYGFSDELEKKFPQHKDAHRIVSRLYDVLPTALHVACNNDVTVNCHGCVDIGFDPNPLLASDGIVKYQWITALPKKTRAEACGIKDGVELLDYDFKDSEQSGERPFGLLDNMWADIEVAKERTGIHCSWRGAGLVYTYDAFQKMSTLYTEKRFCGLFRAHQHSRGLNPMMQSLLHIDDDGKLIRDSYLADEGLSKLWRPEGCGESVWPGIVCTHLVAPNTEYAEAHEDYPGFNYAAFSLQYMGDTFENSPLEVIRLPASSEVAGALISDEQAVGAAE